MEVLSKTPHFGEHGFCAARYAFTTRTTDGHAFGPARRESSAAEDSLLAGPNAWPSAAKIKTATVEGLACLFRMPGVAGQGEDPF